MRLLCFAIIILMMLPIAAAIPPIENEFYGSIVDKGFPLGSGKIEARAGTNVSCGNFTIANGGYYGLLSCLGDDPDTARIEGAVEGEGINFYLDTTKLFVLLGLPYWHSANFTRIDLSTPAICGDSYCDSVQGETCSNCLYDCGICGNATINVSQNITPGGGGGGIGAGGGGGAVSAGAAIGVALECKEYWRCGDWKPKKCPINETQARKCIDTNACDTAKNKPNETRHCIYSSTCDDLVLNGNESDVDCGGMCAECELDKKCRVDSDCKSHACDPYKLLCIEPAVPKLPEITKPRMPRVISPGIIPCGKDFPWMLFLILLLFAFGAVAISEMYLFYLRYYDLNYRKVSRVQQLKKEILIKRRAFWIALAIFTVDVFLSLYIYINNGCPQYSNLTAFFIIVTVVILFFAIYKVLMKFEYEEKRSHKMLLRMLQNHQTKMSRILQIENMQLGIFEKEILAAMEISREAIKDIADLKKIYENIVPVEEKLMAIVNARLNKQQFDKLQSELSRMIEELSKNAEFEASVAASSTLLAVYSKLKLLRDRYLKRDEIAEDLEKTINSPTSDEVKEES